MQGTNLALLLHLHLLSPWTVTIMASKLNPLVLHLCRTLHTSGRWVTRLHGPECAITAKFCLLPIPRPRSFSSISQLDGVDGIKAVPDSKYLNLALRHDVVNALISPPIVHELILRSRSEKIPSRQE